MPKESLVLGALMTDLDFPNENAFAAGLVHWAADREVTIVLLPGGPLHSRSTRNAIFRLANETWLDGLIMSPFLRHLVPVDEMTRFCEQYAPLPIVMGATGLESVPHVRVDSLVGMQDLVSHLIESHHLSQIAFITGPEGDTEAEERCQGYVTALREHGLEVDPDRVVPGDFREVSGVTAMRRLLDAGVTFDAVVGANDAMAVGAYSVLHEQGLNVPEDVALAGFDDAPDFRGSLPLTTVRQSFYEVAHQVGDILMDLIQGRHVSMKTLIPAPLVVRGSCGCVSERVLRAAVDRTDHTSDLERDDPLEEAHRPQGVPAEIWRAFRQDLREADAGEASSRDAASEAPKSRAFLRSLGRHMRVLGEGGVSPGRGHQILNDIRRAVVPFLNEKEKVINAEDLLQQARVLVAERVDRLAQARLRDRQIQAARLRTFDTRLESAQDIGALVPAIQETLPQLGVHQCYLVRWTGGTLGHVRLLVAVNEQRAGIENRNFAVEEALLPDGVISAGSGESLVALPLTVENEVLGYAVVNWGPQDGGVYHRIEARLSGVLYRLRLLADAEAARREAEEALEEVVATRSIGDRLQRAVDTEAVLRITLEELSKALGAPTAVARLGTREQLLGDGEVVEQ